MTPSLLAERAGLLRACCERPADDVPRLILADWLEENGEAERGEFVRVQISLASCVWAGTACSQCESLRRRERELLAANQVKWRLDLPSGWANWVTDFRRGLVAEIALPLAPFLAHAKEIFAIAPVEVVRLTCRAPAPDSHGWNWAARERAWRVPLPSSSKMNLPWEMFVRLQGGQRSERIGATRHFHWYDTEEAARAALSRATVAWGRGEVTDG